MSSVTSRGKHTPPKFWRRVWKMGRFPRLQYGATLPLSTLNDGVDSWIASLRATRASPTASPAGSGGKTTTAGYSNTSLESSRTAGLIVSSARTSRGTLTVSLKPSSRHWSEWVAALRLEYSARKKLGLAIAENDSSSWPTAQSRGHKGVDRDQLRDANMRPLNEVVAHWRTPNTLDSQGGSRIGESESQEQLCHQITQWPTPRASEAGPDFAKGDRSDTGMALPAVAAMWGTPVAVVRVRDDSTMAKSAAFRASKGKKTTPLYIGEQAERWATPRATDGAKGSPNQAFGEGGGVPLAASASRWATPDVPNGGRKLKKGTSPTGTTPEGDKRQVGLENQVGKWTTPTLRDSEGGKTKFAQGGSPLAYQSDQWRTPTSLSFGESHTPGNNRNQNINMTLAGSLLGLPVHLIPDGPESSWLRRFVLRQYRILSSPKSPSWRRLRAWCVRSMRRKLGESFVEWMHGWPIGWTDSENAVTGFQVWLARSRGELSKLCSAQPIDRNLFD